MQQIEFLSRISDAPNVCAYLPDQIARMPLEVPSGEMTPERFDQLLAAGYRRSGWFFYHTMCPECRACEPLRLEVERFRPSRSQRRVQKRGQQQLRAQLAEPMVDARRLELFNRHRIERALSCGEPEVGESEYRSFLIQSHVDVAELSLWYQDRLVAVSITDAGADSLSAVYCYFDPDFDRLSLGTFAILQQIECARQQGFRWLYLGMMVANNAHLRYKIHYRPHQRRIQGQWIPFD